jgi:hypothetical protein
MKFLYIGTAMLVVAAGLMFFRTNSQSNIAVDNSVSPATQIAEGAASTEGTREPNVSTNDSKPLPAGNSLDPQKISSLSFAFLNESLPSKKGEPLKWTSKNELLSLIPRTASKAPLVKTESGTKYLEFAGGDALSSEPIQGSQIVGAKEASFVAVVRTSPEANQDLFGWGDCQKTRYLAHVPAGKDIIFQFGDPNQGVLRSSRASVDGNWQVLVGSRGEDRDFLLLNGIQINAPGKLSNEINLMGKFPLLLGISACNNSFKGSIAEVYFFKTGLKREQAEEVTRFLFKKFKMKVP